MSWNYRVVRVTPEEDKGGPWYEVREVYYDADGQPNGYTSSESGPGGETLDELRADLDLIRQAFDRPVLNLEDLAARSSQSVVPRSLPPRIGISTETGA